MSVPGKRRKDNSSRQGNSAELKAVLWLWEQGFEVFRNSCSTGPADLVVWDKKTPESPLRLVDVKNATIRRTISGEELFAAPKPRDERVELLLWVAATRQFYWGSQVRMPKGRP
jgi:Holliday junction resolvase-like predicted endonuclease